MQKKIINFRGITFYDMDFNDIIKKLEEKGGVLVAPAASALVNIENDSEYYEALIKSDIAILDSGFFCILWRLFKKEKLKKLSGYLFLKKLIKFLKYRNVNILTIDPTKIDSKLNKEYLNKNGLYNVESFVAPIYTKNCIQDKNLINIINNIKPNYIFVNLGGQTQEVLGNYIKNNTKMNIKIICTGAAIAFLTKRQAPINDTIDRFYLGWFYRLIYGPKYVVERILKSFLLIKFFF
jgi:UDP-N-acetyl-D-mannosaminuronic acid transferase (WecB/TagA/CpsF family)